MRKHFKETWKNKIVSLLGILAGILSCIWAKDATLLVFLFVPMIGLFFERENYIGFDFNDEIELD